MRQLVLVWLLAATVVADPQLQSTGTPRGAASYSPTSERPRQRTTELTKTSEVIQKVVQAAIQSAYSRRAYRNRTRMAESPAVSTPGYVLRPARPKVVYHSSYKNSSGVIQPLPVVREDLEVSRSMPPRVTSRISGEGEHPRPTKSSRASGGTPDSDQGVTRPTKLPRLSKYARKLSGNPTTFSPGTTRATPTQGVSTTTLPPQQGSSVNNNLALKILKRPSTTAELKTAAATPPSTVFEPPYVSVTRTVKQGSEPGSRRLTASSLASSSQNVYSLAPFRGEGDRWQIPSTWAPEHEQSQTTDGTKHTLTGNIALSDGHIKISHISPKVLSSLVSASTTDRMKLFSVTIKTNSSSLGNYGTTERILQASPGFRSSTPGLPFVTGKYQPRRDNVPSQRTKESTSSSSTAKSDNLKLTTTRSIPVLSVKLNATRETSLELAQKQGQVSDGVGSSLVHTSPTVPAGKVVVGQGTTVEVSWKQSVTKSTTTPPRTNSIQETTLISETQNPEDFFKLLHDMTSSTYKRNITFGGFDSYYRTEPRNNNTESSGRTYKNIQRTKHGSADVGQIQYSGISNSVVILDVSEPMDTKDSVTKMYTSKTPAVFVNKAPSSVSQAQTSGRPATWATQSTVQQQSTTRPLTGTRSARRQVFMFRTPASVNEIQKPSESGTSEVTFSGSTTVAPRGASRTSDEVARPPTTSSVVQGGAAWSGSRTQSERNEMTLRGSTRAALKGPARAPGEATTSGTVQGVSVGSSSRTRSAGRDRRVTTLPPETTGRFFGWLAALQGPPSARKTTRDAKTTRGTKTTRDAKTTATPEDKPQPSRLQRIFAAMQTVADALMEVPRQIWMLPIRFGLYPLVNRVQEEVPDKVKFPCSVPPPGAAPRSVHRLRPGDIRVVAALGDSITTASGALANSEEEARLNYRGLSAMAGGQAQWRKYLTLPNILKEFNPKLLGYSLGMADTLSGLNVAENGALDDQLLQQARTLVNKIRADLFIDFDKDWKLVNLLIGGNDICNEYCFVDGSKDSPSGHRQNLEVALDYLQTHLPRTLVNLIHVPNMVLLRNLSNVPFSCYMKQLVLCSCLFGSSERAKAESVSAVLRGYWDVERTVASLEKYDTDNFTVVLQPFFIGVRAPSSIPTLFGHAPDLSFFAPDCFHFSQRANSLVANALWNNMLEPVGNKSYGWQPLLTKFRCPSEQAPYLFTSRNSRAFLHTGLQDPA